MLLLLQVQEISVELLYDREGDICHAPTPAALEVYVGSSSLPVTVYTDHNPLVFQAQMCNSNQHLMRWALLAQNYNLIIKHKKGADNIVADTLSRG